jgi:hypothetical protein
MLELFLGIVIELDLKKLYYLDILLLLLEMILVRPLFEQRILLIGNIIVIFLKLFRN